jgi:hypothetical protein
VAEKGETQRRLAETEGQLAKLMDELEETNSLLAERDR